MKKRIYVSDAAHKWLLDKQRRDEVRNQWELIDQLLLPKPKKLPVVAADIYAELKTEFGVDQAFIDQILKHRREIKSAKPSPKVINLILKEMIKALSRGLFPSMEQCLNYFVNETTWKSFKAEWVSNQRGKTNATNKPDRLERQAAELGIDIEFNRL